MDAAEVTRRQWEECRTFWPAGDLTLVSTGRSESPLAIRYARVTRGFDLWIIDGTWWIVTSEEVDGRWRMLSTEPLVPATTSPVEVAVAFWERIRVPSQLATSPVHVRGSAPFAPAAATRSAMVPAVSAGLLLLVAIAPWDYWFYPLLRIAITGLSIWLAIVANRCNQLSWTLFAIVAAILFNPLIPVYSTRKWWVPVDLISAIVFFFAARFVVPRPSRRGK